jgi:hypothetical protein
MAIQIVHYDVWFLFSCFVCPPGRWRWGRALQPKTRVHHTRMSLALSSGSRSKRRPTCPARNHAGPIKACSSWARRNFLISTPPL